VFCFVGFFFFFFCVLLCLLGANGGGGGGGDGGGGGWGGHVGGALAKPPGFPPAPSGASLPKFAQGPKFQVFQRPPAL